MSGQNLKPSKHSLGEIKTIISEFAAADGTLPPEREMVDELNVPRSRLRRVLAEMREEGLISPAQIGRRNSKDASPQIENLARITNPTDVIEMRLFIEPQFARLAAIKASSLEIARITRAAQSQPGEDYGAPDLAFHLAIASATRNALAREVYRILRQVASDARVRLSTPFPMCPNRQRTRDAEHMKIARAIADRDPGKAEEAMRSHLIAVQAVILNRMAPDQLDGSAS